jgi:hypothetical protein
MFSGSSALPISVNVLASKMIKKSYISPKTNDRTTPSSSLVAFGFSTKTGSLGYITRLFELITAVLKSFLSFTFSLITEYGGLPRNIIKL